jgi:outer membrane protein assembly factor BamB
MHGRDDSADTTTRRSVLQTVAVGAGAVGTLGVGLAEQAAGDRPRQSTANWPSYRGNGANSGYVSGPDGVATAVEERWVVESDPKPNRLSVRDGRVYLSLDNGEDEPYEGAVRALDAETGEDRWRFDTDRWMQSVPVARGGAVYALANADGDGWVHELDASDGTERWSQALDDEPVAGLAVVDDTVYAGTVGGELVAMDRDGGQRWRHGLHHSVWDPPAVVDGTVYVTGDNATINNQTPGQPTAVYALDADTGRESWRYEVGQLGATAPVVSDGVVYVTDDSGTIHAVGTGGTREWTGETDDDLWIPTVHDRTVYLPGSKTLYALDASDGSVEWRIEAETDVDPPVGTTDALYTSVDGALTAVDPGTGATRTLRTVPDGPTAVAGDTSYVQSDSTVSAFEVTERASGLPVPIRSRWSTSDAGRTARRSIG